MNFIILINTINCLNLSNTLSNNHIIAHQLNNHLQSITGASSQGSTFNQDGIKKTENESKSKGITSGFGKSISSLFNLSNGLSNGQVDSLNENSEVKTSTNNNSVHLNNENDSFSMSEFIGTGSTFSQIPEFDSQQINIEDLTPFTNPNENKI